MKILGIETSHDDTSIAIWENGKILDLITISQIDIFKEFGGTIPELSSREHVKNISIIQKLIQKKHDLNSIDYIAYTEKPGLIGTLQIGYLFANALSLTLNKPLFPIDHLEGHFFSASIGQTINYPALALLVSGGHTQLMIAKNPNEIEILGQTLDDAVGEAYDKVSTKLGLGFPGGPVIDLLYQQYIKKPYGELIKFTTPHTTNEFDFSLSGLKSQVINYHHNLQQKNLPIDNKLIAISFQECVVNYLIEKVKLALEKQKNIKSIVLCGGVSANTELRKRFLNISSNAIIPLKEYSTDNGAMIAECLSQKLKYKK